MYMQEYTPTLEIQVKSNKGQCGILIFVEAFRWTLKLHLFIFVFEWLKHCIACSFSTMWMCWAFRICYMYMMYKDFFIMLCYTRLSQKFNWQVTLFSQAARAMKILQQKEYAYVLWNSFVWKCPVFFCAWFHMWNARFEAFHAVDEIWKRRGSISVSYFTGDT